jgi:uncharacterized protein DUF481
MRARTAGSLALLLTCAAAATAADETPPPKKKPWTNDTELSVVATQGNSDTLTLGFKDRYETPIGKTDQGRFRFKFEGTLANKADERFVVASIPDPGQPIDPQNPCAGAGVSCATIEPAIEDSIERYLVEGRYDQKFSERAVWNAGASWDRNLTDGSGVESRTIGFAGLGNIWWDKDDFEFTTNYSLSYTDRRETTPDPEKDDTFLGVRFDWSYRNDWTKTVTYRNTWTINASLSDGQDYGFDMVNSVGVSVTERVAIKVSLQWLYNNLPPLETVDLDCANPDPTDPRATVPCNLICVDGTGSIVACTAPGAVQLNDETDIRKEKTDLIFNTSLVIKL